jgi:pSer/pThr/pTyr-binding forkhead associated (FHA) protein
MGAELVVVNGPLAGTRYSFSKGELLVGRAPNSHIVLSEPEVAWRHCHIRQHGDRFTISDLRTSVGTYVNGMRSAERWLEDRDQIGIGRTILMFRTGETVPAREVAVSPPPETKPVLLAACSLVFLFRALAAASGIEQTRLLRRQILGLVSDLVRSADGI